MDAPFWHKRWARNEIGFHLPHPNPMLTAWWPTLDFQPDSAVWVPLCGKTHDMRWLRDHGHVVVGVELSREALDAFIDEQHLALTWRERNGMPVATGQGYTLYCGDFFDVSADMLRNVGAVYDRAALIALPPTMRAPYVAHLLATLPSQWDMLLITLEYPDNEMQGPPFSVDQDEVQKLFAHCNVQLLEARNILAEQPRFRDNGLSALVERAWRIRPGGRA
ncbi:MAG: thiopurine S-methyltransferase [Alcanivorax sp.]|nr:thiopurine S-methyltransferase [Alcanivorax sp.]